MAATALPEADGMDSTGKRKLFPLRQRTGTAAFHLSKAAVDFGNEDIERMTDLEVVQYLARARWGSTKEMPCPHCSTVEKHYWHAVTMRWKCKGCGSRFSVTSKTVFADHKLSLKKILRIAFDWANGASGKPALQLRRNWNVAYHTAFTLAHKLREGLLRGHNVGVLCGVHEMDGMDVNGRRYKEKRNRPQGGGTAKTPTIPKEFLKVPEQAGPPDPPKRGKAERQHPDRRILIVLRQRGKTKGKGASATRIGIAITESGAAVTSMATQYASAESVIMSDEDTSYSGFKDIFSDHKSVAHSKTFSLPDGTNNNQAESFNARMRRGVEGIYLCPSNKYLKDYGAEQAWREDVRRLSTGEKLKHLFSTALSVGPSLWWAGYIHGHHRTEELLINGNRHAEPRGKKRGAPARLPR